MHQPPSLFLVAGIGIAVAAAVSLFYPLALRASQALYDLVRRKEQIATFKDGKRIGV